MNNRDQIKNDSAAKKALKRAVAILASLVFLFLVYKVWMFYNLSAIKVFRKNYSEIVIDSLNGDSTPVSTTFIEKDYKKTIQLAASSRNIKDNYLAAHAQLALNNPSGAIIGFKKVIDMSYVAGGSDYKDAAEYNLILSYIRNRDYDLALELMTRLKSNPAHTYHDKMTDKLFRQVKMLKWR